MAVSKVTLDALSQMANILRQSAEDIVSAKGEMDGQLRSFIWDDPVGQTFVVKYEEDFKPLTNKLIPNIEQYVNYLYEAGYVISDYSEELGLIAGGIGGAVGIAKGIPNGNSEALVDLRPRSEKKSIEDVLKGSKGKAVSRPRNSIGAFLAISQSGGIIWNNRRFKELETDNASYLETKEGKDRLAKARAAFKDVNPNLSSVTYDQLYTIVGQTIGLKKNEVVFEKGNNDGAGVLGWHPSKSNKAILNRNEETNMSICQKIAVYAHESGHIAQDMVINNAKNKPLELQTPYERKLVFADETYPSNPNRDYAKYHHNYKEVDARRYEIVFGKACVDYYNQTRNSNIK